MLRFRDFVMRGNVIDTAAGIVIGTTFGRIVTSLVNGVIVTIIDFLIVPFVIFFVLREPTRLRRSEPPAPATKECPDCLSVIPLVASRCAHWTVWLRAAEVV